MAKIYSANYKLNKKGHVILNDDNDAERRMVEVCYRTRKTLMNPIVDWTDEDVWGFIHERNLPYCSLYDDGFKRLGCIGCPMAGTKQMIKEFERWPQYKRLYLKALQRMANNHRDDIKILNESFTPDEKELAMLNAEKEKTDAIKIFIHWLRMGAT